MKRVLIFFNLIILCLVFSETIYAGYAADGWAYRGAITFPDAGTGKPRLLVAANFDANISDYSYGNGSDLRFSSDSTGDTPLAFMIEHKQDPFSSVYVNVPTGVSKIYYWVGKYNADYLLASDTYGSNNTWAEARAVYLFDKTRTAEFAANGTTQPIPEHITGPSSYYYNGKTYIAWQGVNQDPYITMYDNSTGVYATPVRIGTNPLIADDHGNIAIIVDNSGYIHAFFGSHCSAQQYAKSTNAEDISAWTSQTAIETSVTYPHVLKTVSGALILVLRSGGSKEGGYVLLTSADSFASSVEIIQGPANDVPYVGQIKYDAENGRLWMGWCVYNFSTIFRSNIYCAYYNVSDGHMYTAGGVDLGTRVDDGTEQAACLIIDTATSGFEANIPFVEIDGYGNPHMLCPVETSEGFYYVYTQYTGTEWTSPEQISYSGNLYNTGVVVVNETSVDAYMVVSEDNARGGDLDHYRKKSNVWGKCRSIFDQNDPDWADFVYDGADNPKIVDGARPADKINIVFAMADVEVYTPADKKIYAINHLDNYVSNAITKTDKPNVYDYSGIGNHATLVNAPTCTISGMDGEYMAYNGSDEYSQLPAGVISDRTQFTVSLWVFIDGDSSYETDAFQAIFCPTDDLYLTFYYYEADAASHPAEFNVFTHDGAASTSLFSGATSLDTWYHLAVTYDLSDNLIFYVNGVPVASAASVNTPTTNTWRSRIGANGGAFNRYLYGGVDSIFVFPTALSGTEIAALYDNQSVPETYPTEETDLEMVGTIAVPCVVTY